MKKYEKPSIELIAIAAKEIMAADTYEEVDYSQMISKTVQP